MRGVVGACELVQLQRSCAVCKFCCECGESGGDSGIMPMGEGSATDIARPDLVVSSDDVCLVSRLELTLRVLTRTFSGSFSGGGGGVASTKNVLP